MIHGTRKMPKARLVNTGRHDPFEPLLPDGIPLKVEIEIDPQNAQITIDLRDNIDNIDCGFNESEACTVSAVMAGAFNSLDPEIPPNSGSFRRPKMLMREGAVVGKPKFPHSCSVATTNVAHRLGNCPCASFRRLGDGRGPA